MYVVMMSQIQHNWRFINFSHFFYVIKFKKSGAENHQPVCPVNDTATATEKEEARCDRNEGASDVRFTNAAQAYMEWMPIRRGPGRMGVITTTSITQVIEWGKLATIAAFDTRVSYRSKTPTVADCKSTRTLLVKCGFVYVSFFFVHLVFSFYSFHIFRSSLYRSKCQQIPQISFKGSVCCCRC